MTLVTRKGDTSVTGSFSDPLLVTSTARAREHGDGKRPKADEILSIARSAEPTPVVYFEVPGPYGVKGSTWSFPDYRTGTIRTKTDSKHGRAFAAAVKVAALEAGIQKIPKGTGVAVLAVYAFIPPARSRGRVDPCVRPDVDKLGRALLDALTGVAYVDDGQVTTLTLRKIYADRMHCRVFIQAEKPRS